jgi:hypothetical protein
VTNYLLGLATLPGLLLLYVLGLAVLMRPGRTWITCGRCHREWHPRRWDTRWTWRLWERRQYTKHMRDNDACREYSNRWLKRRGAEKSYNARGRLVKR